MVRLVKQDKQSVIRQAQQGKLDAITLSRTNIVDDIVSAMHRHGVASCIREGFEDKRRCNSSVPFDLVFLLSVAAEMKVHTSLRDIPYAINDHKTLCELGYTLINTDRDEKSGFMSEGTLRLLFGKYTMFDFINSYNNTVQNYILPKMDIKPAIHILDCTKITVNYQNQNYENSTIVKDENGNSVRGYKLSTIRGIAGDTGVIEDIRFGAVDVHDLSLSKDMLMTSPVLRYGDIIVNDRGFMSREVMNALKTKRGADTYIPLRMNMQACEPAVSMAKKESVWEPHPSRKRKSQRVALVTDAGPYRASGKPKEDVPLNACVVRDTDTNNYFVFVTTDTAKTARQIIMTYDMEDVMRYECIVEPYTKDDNTIFTSGEVYKLDCDILYSFDNDKLIYGAYLISGSAGIKDITPFRTATSEVLKEKLTEIYGASIDNDVWDSELHREYGYDDIPDSLNHGRLTKMSTFGTNNTRIILVLGRQNMDYFSGVDFILAYYDKKSPVRDSYGL